MNRYIYIFLSFLAASFTCLCCHQLFQVANRVILTARARWEKGAVHSTISNNMLARYVDRRCALALDTDLLPLSDTSNQFRSNKKEKECVERNPGIQAYQAVVKDHLNHPRNGKKWEAKQLEAIFSAEYVVYFFLFRLTST